MRHPLNEPRSPAQGRRGESQEQSSPLRRDLEQFIMSFDALTIMGIAASVLCGGFFAALVARNDPAIRPTVARLRKPKRASTP